jgi:hypothetical protein
MVKLCALIGWVVILYTGRGLGLCSLLDLEMVSASLEK